MSTTVETLMMRLRLQRTAAAAAAAVAERAPSPQANERRMAKETQAETATSREPGKTLKKLAVQVYSTASWTLPDRCIILAFVSRIYIYMFVVLSAAKEKAPRALCLISHTPPISI